VGQAQNQFLNDFKRVFKRRSGLDVNWTGGQVLSNTAGLASNPTLRRPDLVRQNERFELGDLGAKLGDWQVVVEFESGAVTLSNLLKYWPYVRGELSTRPSCPLLVCHFSNWWSYATRRDLWQWTLEQMKNDRKKLVDIEGQQFDHWHDDERRRRDSIAKSVDWVLETTHRRPSGNRS
jgi:hypothetical protein